MHLLVLPQEYLLTKYSTLLKEVDKAVADLTNRKFKNKLHCKAGCSSCCMKFSVLPFEAAVIQNNVNISVNVNQGVSAENECCSLLQDNLCRIYEVRPIICRTQGVPLGYIDDLAGTIEVSACHLNFPEDVVLEFDDLLLMDEYNRRLAELNIEYCQLHDIEPETRIELSSIFAE